MCDEITKDIIHTFSDFAIEKGKALKLSVDEFEKARLEYNQKQTREDRKIEDYFKKV